jgi:precorrin-6B C5,15-methyltransferase / cobalt-precorrin-6B C5,C15-methyltransferase
MIVLPHVSAFSLGAARLGWALERCALLTVHGRTVDCVARHVAPGARLIILAHDGSTPAAIRDLLLERGFGGSRMVALAHMGGAKEWRAESSAREFDASVPDFHTLCVECAAAPGAHWHPRTGIPDDAFEHDGKLSKREIRTAALAKLMPRIGGLLIDVGAGCGSIAIEWLRAEEHTYAIALEPRADRRAMAARNAAAFGVPHLDILDGMAPEALAGLPDPDAIFIGGGLTDATLAASVKKLKPDGHLVAHAVTLESEAILLAAYARNGGELVRIAITRAEPIGAFTGWRAAMPVTQWAWRKA